MYPADAALSADHLSSSRPLPSLEVSTVPKSEWTPAVDWQPADDEPDYIAVVRSADPLYDVPECVDVAPEDRKVRADDGVVELYTVPFRGDAIYASALGDDSDGGACMSQDTLPSSFPVPPLIQY